MTQVERNGGEFVVDAQVLAEAFGVTATEVPELMRAGAITSVCEKGVEADEGNWRFTFYHDGQALRMTVDAAGEIVKRSRFPAARRPAAGD
ncbi:hypothetical protein SAMN05444007_101448 [Cribrihabitans marinus]|uniref:Uncharacterized protein n=1 Tax=Cribrihabitans marinus TaxID=1227549 RepID=A0A1H6R980_9RHOB|nr:DUF6522 family protein [Cribrihabitans marinus]GGH20725.1 hypothetical protein GCM10010973_04890 [Cribrihabitans marinus]SEI52379.1 hypothetical protein SAMN05444007_101448 [Cribrihabitans marinus]